MINILIVDDHLIMREGLKRIINETPDIKTAAEASSGQEAMDLIYKNKYDLILLDISMPKQNGLVSTVGHLSIDSQVCKPLIKSTFIQIRTDSDPFVERFCMMN